MAFKKIHLPANKILLYRKRLTFHYTRLYVFCFQETVDNSLSKTNKYFPILCEWISHFLASNGDMTASTIGNNLLVKQVIA